MHCDHFCAEISVEACRANQRVACRAIRLLDAGLTLFTLDEVSMDRLLVCGQCECAQIIKEKHQGSQWLDTNLVMETCLGLAKEVEEADWEFEQDEETRRQKRLAYNREWFRANREWNRERVRQWRAKAKAKANRRSELESASTSEYANGGGS